MKKMFMIAVLMLVALSLKAQTVTQENLQGRWDLIFMEANGITIDLQKKSYVVSDKAKEEFAGDMEMIDLGMQQLFEADFRLSMEFKGTQSMLLLHKGQDNQTKAGTYVIEPGIPQRLTITDEDGEKKTEGIAFKDGNLEVKDAEGTKTMIFKKT